MLLESLLLLASLLIIVLLLVSLLLLESLLSQASLLLFYVCDVPIVVLFLLLLTTRQKIKISFILCQCSNFESLLLLVSLMLPVSLLHVAGCSTFGDIPTDSSGPATGTSTIFLLSLLPQ